jgi:hypothetical protein
MTSIVLHLSSDSGIRAARSMLDALWRDKHVGYIYSCAEFVHFHATTDGVGMPCRHTTEAIHFFRFDSTTRTVLHSSPTSQPPVPTIAIEHTQQQGCHYHHSRLPVISVQPFCLHGPELRCVMIYSTAPPVHVHTLLHPLARNGWPLFSRTLCC